MAKNLPCNAGDMSSSPGQGTNIPYAIEHLGPCALTTEATCHNQRVCALKRKILHEVTKIPCVSTKTQGSQIHK